MTDVSKMDLNAIKADLAAPFSRKLKTALRSLHRPFNEHNDRAVRSGKKVGRKSQIHRRERVELCIRQVHALGYEIEDGANLGQKHIAALMRYWLAVGHKACTIQNHMTALRTYLSWMGKGDMVGPAETYLPSGVDPERVRVPTVARSPKGWAENGVDLAAKIRELIKIDDRVAMVLLVEAEFGLRRREAAVFRPGVQLDRLGGTITLGAQIEFSEGTKGGRRRTVVVVSQRQIEVIKLALKFCNRRGDSLIEPGMNLDQFDNRMSYVLRKAGFTKANFCNPHALRHTYAVALYEGLTGYEAPVRGNGRFNPVEGDPGKVGEILECAQRAVAENLGHNRPQVSRAYLGGIRAAKKHQRRLLQHRTPNTEGVREGDNPIDQ